MNNTDALAHDDYDEYMEGPTCPSCDGCVSPGQVTCPCGAVIDDEAFWQDHMPGATFEERMRFEVELENEDRAAWGAPLIF